MYYFTPTLPFYSNFTLLLQLYPFTPTLPFYSIFTLLAQNVRRNWYYFNILLQLYPLLQLNPFTPTLNFYSNFTLLLQLYSLAI